MENNLVLNFCWWKIFLKCISIAFPLTVQLEIQFNLSLMDVNYAISDYLSVNGWIKHCKSERYMYSCFYQNKVM